MSILERVFPGFCCQVLKILLSRRKCEKKGITGNGNFLPSMLAYGRKEEAGSIGGYLGIGLRKEKGPSLLIGDFNDRLSNEENEGGNTRSVASMRDFRKFCGSERSFWILATRGTRFTWWNNQECSLIQQRLDRGLAC